MKIFKKYNLGLTRTNYFKINKLIQEIEQKKGEKPTKSEIINLIIKHYEFKDVNQLDIYDVINDVKLSESN